MDSSLNIGYSTCPNDTFIFCHLAQKTEFCAHLQDVETLNRWAFEERLDVTKLSFHAWLKLRDRYTLLNAGSALGRGCGPLVIVRRDAADAEQLLADGTVAVPGEYTTAHLLLRLWRPDIQNRIFMPFDRIMDAVASGEADAGVIIHEGRFVYEERGFCCVQDLGAWWEDTTGLPIPLGCIAARASLGRTRIAEIEQQIRTSVQTAFDDPESTRDYVKRYAQELDDAVIREHIQTYVNHYTLELGDDGRAAVEKLAEMAESAGVL